MQPGGINFLDAAPDMPREDSSLRRVSTGDTIKTRGFRTIKDGIAARAS
jgi:hypothetical protein